MKCFIIYFKKKMSDFQFENYFYVGIIVIRGKNED